MNAGNLLWREGSGPSEDVCSWCEGGGADGYWAEGDSEWPPAAANWKKTTQFLCIVLNGRKRLCKLECDLKSDFEEANLDLDSKLQPTQGP